jgi:hypothetical protein
LETAATLEPGEAAVTIEGKGGTVEETLGSGGEVAAGTARLRLGRSADFEITGEGGAAFVLTKGSGDDHRGIYLGRVGAKYRVARCVALTAGLGGGGSAAGGFFSPDLGVVLAYENAYFVPFVSADQALSIPFLARAVDTSEADQPPGTYMSEPSFTWLPGARAGFRIPIYLNSKERISLLGAAGMLGLFDNRETAALFGLSFGAEYRFD